MRMTAECCCWRPLNSLDEKWNMSDSRERKTLTWAAAALQLCGQRTKLSLAIAKLLAIARLCCLVQVYKFIIHSELKSFSREYCAAGLVGYAQHYCATISDFFSAFHICLSLVGSTHDAEGRCTLPTMRGFMSWCTTSYSICNEYENNMKNRLRVSKNSVYSHTSQLCSMEMRKRVEQRRKVGSAHSQLTFYHPARLLPMPHNNGKSLQIPLENWTSSSLWSL